MGDPLVHVLLHDVTRSLDLAPKIVEPPSRQLICSLTREPIKVALTEVPIPRRSYGPTNRSLVSTPNVALLSD